MAASVDLDRLHGRTREALLAQRTEDGIWRGRLATSALSTATACAALALHDPAQHGNAIAQGFAWLAENRNADGGWGDTAASPSNPNTTALVWAAFGVLGGMAERRPAWVAAEAGAGDWLAAHFGARDPAALVPAILAYYGRDYTFSVPICTLLALTGRLDGAAKCDGEGAGDSAGLEPPGAEAWRRIPGLPFELAALPHGLWKWLGLRVVSYALPALIAVGQARHFFAPCRNPPLRWLRGALAGPTLRMLEPMQPTSGGYLEATPLTSFVAACLTRIGHRDHPVTTRAIDFIRAGQRADGGWPIDTSLATWVTTLSVGALSAGAWATGTEATGTEVAGTAEDAPSTLSEAERLPIQDWLLAQQHQRVHPFTRSAPGGWGWMDSDGAVPDADDTAGALLALHHLRCSDDERASRVDPRVHTAALRGLGWLVDLQNRDGGLPTFCRGWSQLPFDQSTADLTAHALRAWHAWRPHVAGALGRRIDRATRRALAYLHRQQRADGAWMPLWFGNQAAPEQANPVYGASRVLVAAALVPGFAPDAIRAGVAWLLAAQHDDGGWSGDQPLRPLAPDTPDVGDVRGAHGVEGACASIEETSLALEALALIARPRAADIPADTRAAIRPALRRGVLWLDRATARGTCFPSAPIGLYFAKLWYDEALYPHVFMLRALASIRALGLDSHPSS